MFLLTAACIPVNGTTVAPGTGGRTAAYGTTLTDEAAATGAAAGVGATFGFGWMPAAASTSAGVIRPNTFPFQLSPSQTKHEPSKRRQNNTGAGPNDASHSNELPHNHVYLRVALSSYHPKVNYLYHTLANYLLALFCLKQSHIHKCLH